VTFAPMSLSTVMTTLSPSADFSKTVTSMSGRGCYPRPHAARANTLYAVLTFIYESAGWLGRWCFEAALIFLRSFSTVQRGFQRKFIQNGQSHKKWAKWRKEVSASYRASYKRAQRLHNSTKSCFIIRNPLLYPAELRALDRRRSQVMSVPTGES
jgi:hypothetical protein